MRFIITSTTDENGANDEAPMTDELFKAYMKYNEDLHRAGVLVASEGLLPGPAVRVVASRGKRMVVDGPFAESKELVGGFYVIDVDSLEEAKAWAVRCPVGMASANVLTIRRLTGADDIPQRYLELAKSIAPEWTATLTQR
ncbi:MAG TPA: YciI family protein [Gammaproteobacteria bacterium]|nr:YciI family protein [Gammaproteobacteria bacterium]